MRKSIAAYLSALLGLSLLWAQEAPLSIAFLGFTSEEIGPSGLSILSDLVKKEIAQAPGRALVSREDTPAALEEQAFSVSSLADPAVAVRAGRLLGARKLMAGSIGRLGSLYIVSLRLVDAETGATDKLVTREFVGPLEDLRGAVRIAAQEILEIPGIVVNQGQFISIESEPPGIGVYVNGLYEGSSPILIKVPKPGAYAVKLQAEGYKTWSQNVKVAEASTYFVKARLLKQEKQVDERVRALQDGRAGLLTFLTVYSAVASDALLFAFNYLPSPEHVRLYVGLPLVAAPIAFFGFLKLSEGAVMNSGRSFFICSSMTWGSSWGLAAAAAFGAGQEGGDAGRWPLYSGLSVLGGTLYGVATTLLTMGKEPFPAARAWLFNLGSALGAFLGLGLPYVLGFDQPGAIYGGMVAGSLAGSGVALWLTRDMVEGRSVQTGAAQALIGISPGVARAGLPLPRPSLAAGGAVAWELSLLSWEY